MHRLVSIPFATTGMRIFAITVRRYLHNEGLYICKPLKVFLLSGGLELLVKIKYIFWNLFLELQQRYQLWIF